MEVSAVLKRRFSLYAAVTAGVLTVLFSVFQDTRLQIILFRTGVSMLIFAILGFFFGLLLETLFRQLLARYQAKGSITSDMDVTIDTNPPEAEFTPLSPENMEQISRPSN